MFHSSDPKRGSALLIVLGLLGFLMISAVAFSISMRTERSAAAAYRRTLIARELLASAFTDARATVDFALKSQRDEAGTFDRDNPDTRTVEALAPFRYPNLDYYGRLITSRNTGSSEFSASTQREPDKEPIAYLLDDTVLRHLPPAIAYNVYATLELQEPFYDGISHKGYSGKYYVDWTAGWKPVNALIPSVESTVGGSKTEINTAVVGRMAWAVVNLSDSVDINGISSASPYRGIGLTGNEFGFGQAPGTSASGQASDRYDLLDSEQNPASSQLDLPTFLSNADLAWYAARGSDALLVTDNGSDIYPYSWESAIYKEGIGGFSPFSVYSFWPRHTRKDEKSGGTADNTTSDGAPLISCDEVKAEDIGDPSSASSVGGRIEELYRKTISDGNALDAPTVFLRMLRDYLDKDSQPGVLDSDGGSDPDFLAQAQPTVENVPMISDVSYPIDGDTSLGSDFVSGLTEALKGFEGKSPEGMPATGYTSPDKFPTTLDDSVVLDIELPAPETEISLRSYFPGYESSEESYTIGAEGFAAAFGSAVVVSNNKQLEFKTESASADLSGGDTGLTADGALFSEGTVPLKSGAKLKLELSGKDLPVANKESATPIQPEATKVRLAFAVDFLFRAKTTGGGGSADICPVGTGKILRQRTDYPKTLNDRFNSASMEKFDGQFFRITRPVVLEFALEWESEPIEGENGAITGYKCKTKLSDAVTVTPKIEPSTELDFGSGRKLAVAGTSTPAWSTLSPDTGTWSAVDPRYNWLSPMLGVSDSGNAYFGGSGIAPLPSFSSPHWTFVQGVDITGGSSSASDVATGYAEAHADIVPFAWGLKAEDVRYGYNDTDQLLLPAEACFLPVPVASSVWGDKGGYLTNSYADYHDKVAKQSFYRTLPVADFNDGALDYDRYVKTGSMFQSFSGDNFPEEHRALVNVFAGQDDYVLCQRLRQFALLGIAPTIKQAAKVTYDRLSAAQSAGRISPKLLDDLDTLKDIEVPSGGLAAPKYDDFIRDYLFPLPTTGGGVGANASDWTREQELYKGTKGRPARPKTLEDFIIQPAGADGSGSFADRLKAYNAAAGTGKILGQNDVTTLVASAKECFGDRQQLFLYILRADSIAYNSGRDLSQHKPLSTARAVALVWRDAYGELPDRVIYYQLLP